MKMKSLLTFVIPVFFLSTLNFAANPTAKGQTVENLKAALLGETTASAKYAAYAKKAEEEGYKNIALLFKAASKSESIHAGNHKAALEQLNAKLDKIEPKFEVKSTKANLQDAIKGESYEVATMYPDFIKKANEEKVNIALLTFNYAYQTEKKHKVLYQNALDNLNTGKEKTMPNKYMVCSTCGNTYDGEAPARCGISMTPKDRFYTIQ
ncbi:MAG: rubrerythrin family protein [Ignavibacteriaceae bacterium]|jgi:rubrerythrin